jgi:hypothetical protein
MLSAGEPGLHEQLPIIELGLEIHKIPVLHEMPRQVNHAIPANLHRDVVPGHPRDFLPVKHARLVLARSVDVADSEVCVVGANPELLRVGELVGGGVPAPVAQV